MHRSIGTLGLVGCLTLVGRIAAAAVLVLPGPGTPVQDAIDAASPGETIRLTLGTYPEHIVITKPLKLRGARSTSQNLADTTLFDGQCAAGPVITVAADDVHVRDLAIVAHSAQAIAVHGRTRVKLKDLFVASNCAGSTHAVYDVSHSTRVTLQNVWAALYRSGPYGPAGIRIADTPAGGRNLLRGVVSARYDVGILLENDAAGSVRVLRSHANFNDRGIVLQGTAGAIVSGNVIIDNDVAGIEVEAGSTGNLISRNRVEGSATDVIDGGAGNCWLKNTYTTGTVPSCP